MRLVKSRLVAFSLLGVLLAVHFAGLATKTTPPIDLAVFLRASRMFATGGGLYQRGWGAPLSTPLPYTYPPLWAAVVSPAALLPWRVVALGWTVVNIAVLTWIVWLSFRTLLGRAGDARWLALAGLTLVFVVTVPVSDVLSLGQLGILLTAACLADTVPDHTRLPRGVLVGVATAVKLIPGVFIIYWLATKRWGTACIAVATAVGLWIISAILRPDLSREFWTRVVFRADRVGAATNASNQSLHGLLLRAGWRSPATYVALAGITLVVGLRRAGRAHTRGDELAAASLVGMVGYLVSPISWIHHAVWIVPIVGVLIGGGSRSQWLSGAAVLGLFSVRFPQLVESGAIDAGPVLSFVLGNAYALALMTLVLLLPIHGRDARPDDDHGREGDARRSHTGHESVDAR